MESWLELGTDWLGSSPLALMGVIVIASYILEDAAVVMAALLAVAGRLAPELALCAAVVGLVSGDTVVYLLGRLAHRHAAVGRWIDRHPGWHRALDKVRHSHWSGLIAMRFIPGMRVAGFGACGLAQMPVGRFLLINIAGAVLWVSLVLGLFMALDALASHWLGPLRWSMMVLAVTVLLWLSRGLWRTARG